MAKTQHSKNEDNASSPITSWLIDGETLETVTDFISGGSKITADGAVKSEEKEESKFVINLEDKL